MKNNLLTTKAASRRNLVIRQVCDRHGQVLDYLTAPHSGSMASIIAAAKQITDQMFLLFNDASNIESRIVATDDYGTPRWTISPNFQVIEEH